VDKSDQYARQAAGWSDEQYADTHTYLEHRARVVQALGPALRPGEVVLDLACGDGGFGIALQRLGLRYRGIDATAEMVAAARVRVGAGAEIEQGDLNDYVPPEPVAATTVFRAIYYARDWRAFFVHAASYTRRKLVFDLNPRQYRLDDVLADLHAAGLTTVALRPFFVPQTRALPSPVLWLARAAERSGPPARLVLRARFTYLVAASR
jgi:SAM-dependent methyltransferase